MVRWKHRIISSTAKNFSPARITLSTQKQQNVKCVDADITTLVTTEVVCNCVYFQCLIKIKKKKLLQAKLTHSLHMEHNYHRGHQGLPGEEDRPTPTNNCFIKTQPGKTSVGFVEADLVHTWGRFSITDPS